MKERFISAQANLPGKLSASFAKTKPAGKP